MTGVLPKCPEIFIRVKRIVQLLSYYTEKKTAKRFLTRVRGVNKSHCRFVVTCFQTDKVAFPDCSHSRLGYLTPPKKYSYGEAGGDEAPQPYPGEEMASYQIRLGSLFYGVNLYREG